MREAVAWHWLDDNTMMVLTDDMVWHRLEGVYVGSLQFNGLEMTDTDCVEIMMNTRYVTSQPPATSETQV